MCGIKWKKLVLNERPHATGDPLEDPVLKSYTRCLAKDLLCVWRRVSQPKNDLDQTGGLGMFDMSQNLYTSVIHPPLSLTAAKELWIFWYGEEPDLTDLVSPELLKSTGKLLDNCMPWMKKIICLQFFNKGYPIAHFKIP